ncbi:MAG: prepilin-type N-terminal cleavage/methylation domain-containing protein [Deltaproteobacteria bacterium]|nr:prepilin-type N-terminal cleavage/methylation domain-containing protein [Deltaproteobacteria bacterium]
MITRRSQRGFSLVELMVVIAIVGIFAALFVSINSKPLGANTKSISDQLVSTMGFARLRATSTRRYHRLEITPQQVLVLQATTIGMATPVAWQQIQAITISKAVTIWNATTVVQITTGNSVTQNPTLSFDMDFRPDGSSTGGTLFLTDSQQSRSYRVLVYHATGSSYARETW